MDNQTERERIEIDLYKKLPPLPKISDIADWHLAEVKRILEPLVNLKNVYNAPIVNFKNPYNAPEIAAAIHETLKHANGG